MQLTLKNILLEILLEASFGKKFPIEMKKNGNSTTFIGIASANAKPGELPYRITWFTSNLALNRHIDITYNDMMNILNMKYFPPEIVQRIKIKWPDDEMNGDEYTIVF
jgi:hypothetical protein